MKLEMKLGMKLEIIEINQIVNFRFFVKILL